MNKELSDRRLAQGDFSKNNCPGRGGYFLCVNIRIVKTRLRIPTITMMNVNRSPYVTYCITIPPLRRSQRDDALCVRANRLPYMWMAPCRCQYIKYMYDCQ